jgi:hypothetical protein
LIKSVLNEQRKIFNIIWAFKHTVAFSGGNGPVMVLLSQDTPAWYHHRLGRDVTFLSARLMRMLGAKEERAAAAAQLALTASVPSISTTSLPSAVVASPIVTPEALVLSSPSLPVVAYTPMSAAMNIAGVLSSRTRGEEKYSVENTNKKARYG